MRTDRELVDGVRAGELAAFEGLVRRYERLVASTAWTVLRDYHMVQDAAQVAFLEAYRQIDQLRHGEHFGAWLLRIAYHEAVRLSKQASREQHFDALAADSMGIDSNATSPIQWQELLAAIGGLPEQERVVVGLRYLDGQSVAEIARLTERPVGTVTKQLSRAVERLRNIFREVET